MNHLLLPQTDCLAASRPAHRLLLAAPRTSVARRVDAAGEALLLKSLAKEHQVSDQLEAHVLSRGALCQVVLALSLSSILLASAVLAAMLGSLVPGMAAHVLH